MADNEPDILFDTPTDAATEREADEAARTEIAAGKFVRHEEVMKWIASWGTPDELPCPLPPEP